MRTILLAVAGLAALSAPLPAFAQDVVVMRRVVASTSFKYVWKQVDGACSGDGQRAVTASCRRGGQNGQDVDDSMCTTAKPTVRADQTCAIPKGCGTFVQYRFLDPAYNQNPTAGGVYENYRTAAGTIAQQKAEAKQFCESIKAVSCTLNMGHDGGKDGSTTSVYASKTRPSYPWSGQGHLFAADCN